MAYKSGRHFLQIPGPSPVPDRIIISRVSREVRPYPACLRRGSRHPGPARASPGAGAPADQGTRRSARRWRMPARWATCSARARVSAKVITASKLARVVGQIEPVELLAVEMGQSGRELFAFLGGEFALDGPVLSRLEDLDLGLTLADKPQRDRLHATCAQPPARTPVA